MRKNYLDNIRWSTVVLVLIYHVFYLFNTVGVMGSISDNNGIFAFDVFLTFVYPWFMVLLFLIAGISARYSLQKRSHKQFIKERVAKLLVPSTLGLFVYHWISGYISMKIGGGLEYIPSALRYPISAISGIGPLWFIQTLFLFSLLLVLLRKFDRNDRLWNIGGKANGLIIVLLAFSIWGAAQIGNMPLLTVYRFGIYGVAFFLGYYVFSHDHIQNTVQKMRIPVLIGALALGVAYLTAYWKQDYTSPQCLKSLLTNAFVWAVVLAILGCGRAWLTSKTKFTDYMTNASFGIYIIHYPIVVWVCYLLYTQLRLPMLITYILAIVIELVLTPLVYELFKKIPVIRYLVLGVRKK